MRNLIIVLYLLCCSSQVRSQNHFIKTLENSSNRTTAGSCITPNNEVVMVGDNVDNYLGEVIKLNQNGMVDWALQAYTATSATSLMCVSTDGLQFYIGGATDSTACIINLDNSGQVIWSKCLWVPNSTNNLTKEIVRRNSFLYIMCQAIIAGEWRPYLVKMDMQGSVLWGKVYMVGAYPANMIWLESAQEFVMSTFDFSGSNLIWVDTTGNVTHSAFYPNFRMENLSASLDTTFLALGSPSIFGPSTIFKLGNSGTLIWARNLRDNADYLDSRYETVFVASDSSIYLGTNALNPAIGPPTALVKMNQTGSILWSKAYFNYTSAENSIHGIHETSDGSLFLTGARLGANFFQSVFLMHEETSTSFGCLSVMFASSDTTYSGVFSDSSLSAIPITPTCYTSGLTFLPFVIGQNFDCPTAIEPAIQGQHYSTFPNPANSTTTFQFSEEATLRRIVITNQLGNEVWATATKALSIEFPASEFSSGMYYYTIFTTDLPPATGKLIIQH